MDKTKVLSICIPTWNRIDFVVRAVEKVIGDPRIWEIIINDDASNIYTFCKLQEIMEGLGDNIKVTRNPVNLDCYANKAKVLSLASNDWCILLDSDNIIDKSYIDAIYALHSWEEDTFYCPEFAKPHFDYRDFSSRKITRQNVHSHVGTKSFDCLINTANYFVHRETYLNLFNPNINPHAADTIYMNSRLLEYGGKLYVVPGMQYFHDVHDGSHYKANNHKSNDLFKELRKKLNDMR